MAATIKSLNLPSLRRLLHRRKYIGLPSCVSACVYRQMAKHWCHTLHPIKMYTRMREISENPSWHRVSTSRERKRPEYNLLFISNGLLVLEPRSPHVEEGKYMGSWINVAYVRRPEQCRGRLDRRNRQATQDQTTPTLTSCSLRLIVSKTVGCELPR